MTVTSTFHMELVNYCFDTRYTDIVSSSSGLYPREAFHRLASPQTSFGVRSTRIHFSPADGFSYEWVAQFNLEWIFSKLDSGFQSLVGFRILSAGFQIPKPRIPDSTSTKFLDSGIRIPLYGATRACFFDWNRSQLWESLSETRATFIRRSPWSSSVYPRFCCAELFIEKVLNHLGHSSKLFIS